MATLSDIKRNADIKYIARDFDSLVLELKNHLKYQFPDSYNDFSDTSSGMAFLELIAYVGDILNFYIDKQFNELFIDTAKEKKNLISLAKNLGYKVRGKAASEANVTISAVYPDTGSGTSNVEFVLLSGTQLTTKDGVRFETVNDIDFSLTTNRTTSVVSNETNVSISGIKVVNGEARVYNVRINNPIPFMRITLPDPDVLEIVSVTSSDLNTWYQVDYLAQENIFTGVQNLESTSSTIPYILTLKKVPRRFVVEKDENDFTTLVFGSGIISTQDSDFIPNPSDFVLPSVIRGVEDGFTIESIDPENFINTGTLGAAPNNVILTIKYRVGGGTNTNVGAGSISEFLDKRIKFITSSSISSSQKNEVIDSIIVTNVLPATGGLDQETNKEIREFAARSFSTQNRVVTIQDYIVRTLTLPSKFGTPFRAYARRDPDTDFGVEIGIITKNSDGTLALPSDQLKINVGNYLSKFKPLNDTLNIVNGKIVNISINFGIVVNKAFNSDTVLANCLIRLGNYFKIDNWQFGQPISISYLYSILQSIQGVEAVTNVFINNLYGTINNNVYSDTIFNISSHTRNNIVSIEPDSIFEIKYSDIDIAGGVIN